MFRTPRLLTSIRIALAGSLSVVLSPYTVAQEPQLEVIVVTPVPGQGVSRERLAANVQTASAADIDSTHAPDLSAFMSRRLGSVFVNDIQNNPFQPDINFRGFTASPLLGTAQGLSVYLDGVRLNQPFGDVVSWDLIPRSAISSVALMPGSNPLFGLNTLGGALNVRTKNGIDDPGTSVQLLGGENQREAAEFEHGGSNSNGVNWFISGNRFREDGWRDDSPSDIRQLFGKVGIRNEQGELALSASFADNHLFGNGMQELRLLERNRESVYTKPDITDNRGLSLNLTGSRVLNAEWTASGNVYYRKIETLTYNGDINDDALDQAMYQPSAAERAALTAGGYTGFPTAGETAANTPFPKWRCIGQVLLNDEPGEKCNALINESDSEQRNHGFNAQLSSDGEFGGRANLFVVGTAYDTSSVDFLQSTELGYLNPDRSVTGTGAMADGEHAGDVDGEPYDNRVDLSADTRTWSLFATDTLELASATHLTLSGRYNRTRVENRDAINPGGGTSSLDGDHEFKRFNIGLGLTHQLNDVMTAYAGLNQGSRAPSAIELGCADPASPCKLPNAMAGDPPLKQVVATTGELGVRGSGAVNWNLGIYRTDSEDDILFVADDTAGFGYFRNFGETRRQGLEAGLSTELAGVTFGANYALIDATYRSEEVLGGESNSSNEEAEDGFRGVEGEIEINSGDRMPLIPRQMLKLFATLPLGDSFSINADVNIVQGSYARGNENNEHEQDGTYYLGRGETSGYAVMNLGADWQALPGLTLFAQVNNVFDHEYATAAQLGAAGFDANGAFVSRPFPANSRGERPLVHSTFYAPGAPRIAWVGVRYRFGD